MKTLLPDIPFSSTSDIIAPMRMIKDKEEIALMKKVGKITGEVYEETLKALKVGVAEYDMASEIDHQFSKRGVEYPSFVTGVRFSRPGKLGPRSIIGPVRTGSTKLEYEDAVTFDFGACYKGYCSDFGRTAFIGEPPAEFRKIHDLVIEAQAAAIDAMVSGTITATQLDAVARNIIEESGYGDRFIHRLGHGIGVSVHEPPYLSRPDDTLLISGMTFTIEPSINDLAGYFRVEDVVLVTESGGKPLTNFHKEISVI